MPKLKKYKVLLSAEIYMEDQVQAYNLKEAEEKASQKFVGYETDSWFCGILPAEKYYWKVKNIEQKMTKQTKKFTCPKCDKDLRKVGVFCDEYGMTSQHIKYDKNGRQQSCEVWDSETDYYYVYCGSCKAKLDIDLGHVWGNLPEKIELVK